MSMRPIRFRVWDTVEKRMFLMDKEPYYQSEYQNFCFSVNFQLKEDEDEDYMQYKVESDNWILMQYTGLKDKNGNEIYEGDIVESYKGIRFHVQWIGNGFALHRGVTGQGLLQPTKELEIVGNIYSNPELLNQ